MCDPALEGSRPVNRGSHNQSCREMVGKEAGWLTEWSCSSQRTGPFLVNWKANIASLTHSTAGSLSASPNHCLMPGHTATEYAMRVGVCPCHPHPSPGQPPGPQGAAAGGPTYSAPPVYLSSHREWRLINTVPWRPGSGSAAPLLSCTLGATGEQPLPPPGLRCAHSKRSSGGDT